MSIYDLNFLKGSIPTGCIDRTIDSDALWLSGYDSLTDQTPDMSLDVTEADFTVNFGF